MATRGWSLFFLLMPLAAVALFAAAPALGWSLPENVSTLGEEIDFLYRILFFITGTVFLGTQFFLVYLMFRFGDAPGRTALYSHGSKRAELIWTMVPAAVIAGVAALQMPTWWKLQESPGSGDQVLARVVGRRFAWEVVHAGLDGQLGTPDDLVLDNELHIPPRQRVWLELASRDVVHSLFLPQLRMKHDAVPGLVATLSVDANKSTLAFRESHADFQPVDLFDAGPMLDAVQKQLRPVDRWLLGRVSPNIQAKITQWKVGDVSVDFEPALLADLQALLVGDDWTQHEAWLATTGKDVRPVDELPTNKATAYPKMHRRSLLAHAYPLSIRRLHKDYEIVCAELCGEGHYQMVGRVVVHESAEDFNDWLRNSQKRHPQESGR